MMKNVKRKERIAIGTSIAPQTSEETCIVSMHTRIEWSRKTKSSEKLWNWCKRECLTNTIKIGLSKKREEEETHTQHDEIQLWDEKPQFWIEIKIGRIKRRG